VTALSQPVDRTDRAASVFNQTRAIGPPNFRISAKQFTLGTMSLETFVHLSHALTTLRRDSIGALDQALRKQN
jgi:hypothetical protein